MFDVFIACMIFINIKHFDQAFVILCWFLTTKSFVNTSLSEYKTKIKTLHSLVTAYYIISIVKTILRKL